VDPRVTLDEGGTLHTSDSGEQRSLRKRAGVYTLARTSPDWMLLLRAPAKGGTQETRPRVVLAGDCACFPLADLIAFLGQSRWSGMLKVVSPSGERTLALKEGEVRSASSDAHTDRIGEVLVRFGFVSRGDLDSALRNNPPSRIGRALVESGLIQAHDLFKCLTEQVSEIFHGLMLCTEGAFLLVDQEMDEKVHNLNLSTQSLLMDSIRKIDEMAHFRRRIQHGRLFVARKRDSDGTLEPDEDQVLALCNGVRTIIELGQAARLSEFDATRIVYRLLEGGYATVSSTHVAHDAGHTTSPGFDAGHSANISDEAKRIINVFNFIFREVRDEVARRGQLSNFLSSANAALRDNNLSSSPLLEDLSFGPDGQLSVPQVLEQFDRVRGDLGSGPLGALRQALSDVMFFLLFQAGELLEQRADEDLARRVKELLATLEAK
jgi:hypothetical protein